MKVFWREEDLSETEAKLLQACLDAHAQSALRQNISSIAVVNAAEGSKDLGKSIVAALSSIGGTHAPLKETYQFLRNEIDYKALIGEGYRISGWGNSFEKGHPDPLWIGVDAAIRDVDESIHDRICQITDALHKSGKVIFPNPSAYTAATAIALRLPYPILEWLFIAGRLNVWTMLFLNQVKKGKL